MCPIGLCSGLRYLLIVVCSQRKRRDAGLLPALERYDGVYFRVLRKARQEGYWPDILEVLIVSAKYGLLELHTAIEHYEQRMTPAQALRLQPVVVPLLEARVTSLSYAEIFVNVGKTYRVALEGWNANLSDDTAVVYAHGGIGQRARHMRQWLRARTASTA